MVQEHEQGSVQGALYGARPLASGTGPLLFAGLCSVLTEPSRRCPSSLGSLHFGHAADGGGDRSGGNHPLHWWRQRRQH
jgi:hypothetical protein